MMKTILSYKKHKQILKKRYVKKNDNLINREIQSEYVIIIDENNAKEKMSTFIALKKARALELDLVQVSPQNSGQIAICKIMDYKKYLYDKKKKQLLIKKNHKVVLIKEIQFRLNTDTHDFETKINHIKRFLSQGHKVKIIIFFRGREINREEGATTLLNKITERFSEISKQDSNIQSGKRTMFLIIAPIKVDSDEATKNTPIKKNNFD